MDKLGDRKKLALVLSGGGARGAYEAGIIHYIRTRLPPEISRHRPFDIFCGSSVGAINTCFMASSNHNLEYQGRRLFEIWKNLNQAQVYRRGLVHLTRLVGRSFAGIMGNFFRKKSRESLQSQKRIHFTGFLDTSPLPYLLKEIISWKQVSLNIQNGSPLAVSVTATNVHTGKMELFIDKHPSASYTGRHRAHFVNLEADHAMASAAIPILFPTVRVGSHHYCDGGLRLNTPLSPAIQLGADKVLVIGLHHITERAEQKDDQILEELPIPPTMGEVMGKVLNSIFLDRLEYDLEQMKRINRILEAGEVLCGGDFLGRFNEYMSEKDRRRDVWGHQFKKLEVFKIFPSQDIRKIFTSCLANPDSFGKHLTSFEKFVFRILDVDLRRGQEFLSFVLFVPEYLQKLLELGFEDAKAHHEELVRFFQE